MTNLDILLKTCDSVTLADYLSKTNGLAVDRDTGKVKTCDIPCSKCLFIDGSCTDERKAWLLKEISDSESMLDDSRNKDGEITW